MRSRRCVAQAPMSVSESACCPKTTPLVTSRANPEKKANDNPPALGDSMHQ